MYYRRPDRIRRNYNRSLFQRRNQSGRWTFVLFMLILIVAIPAVAYFQYDKLQLQALEAIGFAPTPTPFAAERAQQGEAAYIEGDMKGAATYFEIAVTQQPDNINYLYEYGKILIDTDKLEAARALGDRIIAIAPDDPRGYALNANNLVWSAPSEAIPIAITGRELGIPYAPLEGALAIAYNNIGRYQQAIQHGDLGIRIDPMDASARRSYSYPLIFTGRYNEAIEQLETAISINPNLSAPYFELASLYRQINNPYMSIALYERVLEMDPRNARAYLRICETWAADGQFKTAESYCDDALDIEPDFASAHRMRGQLQYSRRNYEGAIESFETCVNLGSTEIACYYVRGLAHYYLGQCDIAWDVLNQALPLAREEQIKENIRAGLNFIISNCGGYSNRALPTAIPPTQIPPTPIGGGY